MILGFVSNSSEDSILKVQQQMFMMNCPLPIYNGIANDTNIVGYNVNYTIIYHDDIKTDFYGTYFKCTIDPLSAPPQIGATGTVRQYGATTFWGTLPYGWLGYVADFLTASFQKITAFFTLISYFVSPTGFDILGYGLSDLSGLGLFLVIGIYAFCYICIGAMIYKIVSPFSGVG